MSPALLGIPPGRREILSQALTDAVYYRDPPVHCGACKGETQGRLCDDCAAGLARARSYLALSRELVIDLPP
jgi:hypothetical protein